MLTIDPDKNGNSSNGYVTVVSALVTTYSVNYDTVICDHEIVVSGSARIDEMANSLLSSIGHEYSTARQNLVNYAPDSLDDKTSLRVALTTLGPNAPTDLVTFYGALFEAKAYEDLQSGTTSAEPFLKELKKNNPTAFASLNKNWCPTR